MWSRVWDMSANQPFKSQARRALTSRILRGHWTRRQLPGTPPASELRPGGYSNRPQIPPSPGTSSRCARSAATPAAWCGPSSWPRTNSLSGSPIGPDRAGPAVVADQHVHPLLDPSLHPCGPLPPSIVRSPARHSLVNARHAFVRRQCLRHRRPLITAISCCQKAG